MASPSALLETAWRFQALPAAQHSGSAQHSSAQQSTAQHGTAQHSTAQHSTAQHSRAHQDAITHPARQNLFEMHKRNAVAHVVGCF